MFKLLNRWVTALTRNDPTEDVAKYSQGSLKDKPQAYYTLNPVLVYNIGAQLYSGEMMPKAIKAKDPSMLNNENKINYENVMKFEAGDANQYGAYMAFKEGGSQPLLYQYFQEGRYLTNAYSGPPDRHDGGSLGDAAGEGDGSVHEDRHERRVCRRIRQVRGAMEDAGRRADYAGSERLAAGALTIAASLSSGAGEGAFPDRQREVMW
ncbi:hypothetical protein [Cohnella rhizosphaerae]|uniref:Uncharacterized protein n=1 Tax=Cohnella rhizosphaerae TaxID=1457232 RepID=A0A9X4KPR9_9BACL|nr:hypothetical protein [Cohnella rhizosphaerae]MDG0808864.1 hypothetical protein [Cohnella rhizosphaerae]